MFHIQENYPTDNFILLIKVTFEKKIYQWEN